MRNFENLVVFGFLIKIKGQKIKIILNGHFQVLFCNVQKSWWLE